MLEGNVAFADLLALLRWLDTSLHARGIALRVEDEQGETLLPIRAPAPAPANASSSANINTEPGEHGAPAVIELALANGQQLTIGLSESANTRLLAHDAREEERRNLASQIHDSIAQTLTSLAIHAEVISGVIQHGIEETRVMVQRLRPPELASGGIEAALRSLLTHTRNVEGRVHSDRNPREHALPERQALALYRVVEALIAPATQAREPWQVQLAVRCAGSSELQLEVSIHGECAPLNITSARSLGEPLEAIGGHVTLVTSATARTVVRLHVPRATGQP